jgi:hypothetical protein
MADNDLDVRQLRKPPGSYGWEYLETGPEVWRIRISKLTTAPLPRILADTTDFAGQRRQALVLEAPARQWRYYNHDGCSPMKACSAHCGSPGAWSRNLPRGSEFSRCAAYFVSIGSD